MRKVVISRTKNGFTLVEVVVFTTLAALLLGVALQCWQLVVRSWLHLERQVEVQDNLRTALELMSGELRLAGSVIATGNSELYFIDGNKGAQVRYYVLNNTSLVREQGLAHPPVAAHIKSLHVRYFAFGGDSPVTDPAAVSLVEITLTGGMIGTEDITMSTAVQLRLKGN